MASTSSLAAARPAPRAFNYGWVVVVACTIMVGLTYGTMYSYSVFFKPLAAHFDWDRSTVSLIYAACTVFRGIVAIGIGWLADRFGSRKIAFFCGLMMGLGLVLSSRVSALWQFFLTYSVVEAIGLSGAFAIGTAVVARWFTKNRGLALGIVATGSGFGTLFMVPGMERLINAVDWSAAFLYSGIGCGILMMSLSLALRPAPQALRPPFQNSAASAPATPAARPANITVGRALQDRRMQLFMVALLLFFFSIQIIMVHLVNYATDSGIQPLIAATLISLVGAISIAGRLITAVGSEKIGLNRTLLFTRIFLVASFLCLIFLKSLWAFYLFAVIFGLCYGGEVPQIPLFVGQYWGTTIMATLVGMASFLAAIGGALGSWVAGFIFDVTGSYRGAFIAGEIAALVSLGLILILNRRTGRLE
jgi:MFS family permease